MYNIVYKKKAINDIPKLKSVKLEKKAKALIEIIKKIRIKHRRPMKS